MSLDAELMSLLVCPACRGKLTEVEEGLHCAACACIYPVRDGIPVMLVEEAISAVNRVVSSKNEG